MSLCFWVQFGIRIINSRTVLCVTKLYYIVLRLLSLANLVRCNVIIFCGMKLL